MSASNTKIQMSNPRLKMDFHPLIWLILQLCLIMQSQLVQAVIGSSFNHQCPDQCLCLSQIQVRRLLIKIYNYVESEEADTLITKVSNNQSIFILQKIMYKDGLKWLYYIFVLVQYYVCPINLSHVTTFRLQNI